MKFYVHKLGCPKNDVDADYISARLIADGHEPVTEPSEAESIVVNTCGFIKPAKEESIDEILRLGQLKKDGNLKTLYASGCLSQRNGDELLEGMPELDGAFGLGALDSIAKAVTTSDHSRKTIKKEARTLGYLSWKDRFISDPFPYSYLKISDGCDRACTYCAIPSMRGKFRSRPQDSIINEAKFLAANGKKELILVSQEATIWGFDLPGRPAVIDLLERLGEIEGVEWIRLMYLYPPQLSDDLIKYMAADNKTLNYFDLPLQHCNSEILANMNRRQTTEELDKLIDRIRELSPKGIIRTTFIVGFPGETDEQYNELKDFVLKHEFERMGVFTYSAEEGTPAALMAGDVDPEMMTDRMDDLMLLQHDIAIARNNSLLDSLQEVIIDRLLENGQAVGRTKADCPDVDQEVTITGENLQLGEICTVRIDAVDEYDLIGTKIGE